jgi:hypothetical protein
MENGKCTMDKGYIIQSINYKFRKNVSPEDEARPVRRSPEDEA